MRRSASLAGRAGSNSKQTLFDRFFFYPEREVLQTPTEWGMSFEDVYFPTEDGVRLHGWYVPGKLKLTIIWFHGNAGNISSRLEGLSLYHHGFGANIFLFDYRGFGHSEGKPTEKGVYRDATAALEHLLSRPDMAQDKIIYYGHSLGGAVAVELAARRPPMGLIVEGTFASGRDMAGHLLPRLPTIPSLLVHSKFNSIARIKKVSCPVMVIHGEQDDVVPLTQGRKLYEAAHEPKQWLEVPGAGHSDIHSVGGEAFLAGVGEFVATLHPIA